MAARPTVRDVARVAGVSHATVSRHLNGHTNVAPETSARIVAAIAEVGFVPNGNARSLVRRRSHNVAFVVREHIDMFYADPTLSRMAAGANARLAKAGYLMPLLIVDTADTVDRVVEMIRGGTVDGAILVAMRRDDPLVRALRGTSTPVVTASAPLEDEGLTWVDTDNQGGTFTITELLLQTGRTRIAALCGPIEAPVTHLRYAGLTEALGRQPEPSLVAYAHEWSYEAGAAAMAQILEAGTIPDGVVAASDLLAAGAMSVLAERGLRVPEDVAIVGFDDSPMANMTTPPLTTVRQDSRRTGDEMAALILERIESDTAAGAHITVPSTVVWRESAGPHPG
ncbi:MAG: LacI family DNA-binding transcriptional regulator [Demequina sp.]|uniref:LacI family DNA-binding transcriptional regulator n=1 Tax=Demequina sp. TaxID=2050685 RepID=UPI003A88363A